jgi:HlyD family secretion protein
MRRRTLVVNSALGVALVGVVALTAVSVAAGGAKPPVTGTTVRVDRGTVTATVTATGNVEAGSTVSVDASGSGEVTKIYVKTGQRVHKGDKLLKIDDVSARNDLETARSNLASAEATMTTTTQGRSSADQAVDDAAVSSAATSLDNARTALAQSRSTYRLDKRQQDKLVRSAQSSLDAAEQQLADDQKALTEAKNSLAAAQAAGDTAAATRAQTTITQLQTSIATDQTTIDSATSGLTQAQQTRDKTLLGGRQAIKTQQGQVNTAEDALAAQKAQRSANRQPARPGAVASAQAQIDNARIAVDKAQRAVRDSTVRAPVDGTVADVTAVVGQSSSTAGGSTASGASGSGATAGGSTAGGGATSSGSSGSGLVTLVDASVQQVTAAVAEADIVKVTAGQAASVSFPASGTTVKGSVLSVATQSTLSDNVVQYDVAVSLPGGSRAIRLGQTADVSITTGSHPDVLYVPTSAITTSGSTSSVTRRIGDTDAVVEVETGLVGANGTEIVRGLSEGDQLVLPTGDSGGFTFPGSGSGSGAAPTSSSAPTPSRSTSAPR